MPTVVFDFEGHSYSYNQATDLLESEKSHAPGIFEPILESEHKKRVMEHYSKVVLGEGEASE